MDKCRKFTMYSIVFVIAIFLFASNSFADRICLVATSNATTYKNALISYGHTVSVYTDVPAVIDTSLFDQFWFMKRHSISTTPEPTVTTRAKLISFLAEGGKVALFTDNPGHYGSEIAAIETFVNDIVVDAVKGNFNINSSSGPDNEWAEVDPVAAFLADPVAAVEFASQEYRISAPAYVSSAGPDLAGGYGVLQIKGQTNKKVAVVFNRTNLAPEYRYGRLSIFMDLENALNADIVSGNLPLLKFIASFTTGAIIEYASLATTEILEDTLNNPAVDNSYFAKLSVVLANVADTVCSVDYIIRDYAGTNAAIGSGVDFNADTGIAVSSGTLNFPLDSISPIEDMYVWIVDDDMYEPPESLEVVLHNAKGLFIDDDPAAFYTYYVGNDPDSAIDSLIYRIPIISEDPQNVADPEANVDTVYVLEGASSDTLYNGETSVLWNDTDTDLPFDSLYVSKITLNGTVGSAIINGNGTFVYTHNGSENFLDFFYYQLVDKVGHLDTGKVVVIVTPVNDNYPVANNDSINVDEGGIATVLVGGNTSVLDNDTDIDLPYDNLTAIVVTDVSSGTLVLNTNGTFSYAHDGSETFSDQFTYEVTDAVGHKDTATVFITINPVNDNATVSEKDSINVDEGATATVLVGGNTSVLDNDTDIDGMSGVTAVLVTDVSHGILVLHDDGTFSYIHDGSENFIDYFEYKANDGTQDGNTVKVSICINPINDNAPISFKDSINVDEGATATVLVGGNTSVLDNDTDIDLPYDNLTAIVVTDVSSGTLVLNTNGTFSYAHDGSETFSDQFTYEVTDAVEHKDTATVFITINPVNDNAPISFKDSINVDEGATATVLVGGNTSVLDNDTDIDGMSSVTAIRVTDVSHGILVLHDDGTFSYIHDGSENFIDYFEYKANDGTQDGNTVKVSICINPVNDNAPISFKDSINVDEGATATLLVGGNTSVLDNDTDIDGMSGVTAVLVTDVSHGTLVLYSNGTFSYIHDDSENFIDFFEYKANDGVQDGNTIKVSIAINPVNDNTPIALDDSISLDEGATVSALTNGNTTVLWNDTDIDIPYDNLYVSLLTSVTYGSLLLNSDGTFIYSHNSSSNFSDSFIYIITDEIGNRDTAKVYITITPINDDTPKGIDDAISVSQGGSVDTLINGEITVLWNDSDGDMPLDSLSVTLVTNVQYGTLILNGDGTFNYIHNNSLNSTDFFEYEVVDKVGHKDTARVSIIVDQINSNTPVGNNDTIAVIEGGVVDTLINGNCSVLDNDTDADMPYDALKATVVIGVTHGSLTLNLNGTFVYLHDGTENFSDSFTYQVEDAAGHTNTALVTIIITPVNDNTPITANDSIVVSEGLSVTTLIGGQSTVLWNDGDLDLPNDALIVTISVGVNHGTLTLNNDGTFIYAHNDSEEFADAFTYIVTDALGHTSIATVFITINPVNDNATVSFKDSINLDEGATATVLVGGNTSVLDNDSDIDGMIGVTAVLVTDVSHGILVLNNDGTFSYIHDGSENFTDFFEYNANDGVQDGNTVKVSIGINLLNDNATISVKDSINVDEGGVATVLVGGNTSVLDNDSDIDGMIGVTAVLVTDVSHGTLILNIDGTFNYIHHGSENFTDFFEYKANDGMLDGNTVKVSITVNPINDNTPITNLDTIFVDEGGIATLLSNGNSSVLDNDIDIDSLNDSLSATLLSNVTYGILVLNSDGTFSYIHDDSEEFLDGFTYTALDKEGHSAVGKVVIIISPVNDNATETLADTINVVEAGVATILKGGANSVLANDSDIDGMDGVIALLVDQPLYGTVELDSSGTFVYKHDGTETLIDSFTYQAFDGNQKSSKTTVLIFISSVNDNATNVVADTIYVDEGGTASELSDGSKSVLDNDTDVDGMEGVTVKLGDDVSSGELTLNQNGTFSYTNNGEEVFLDNFTYIAFDGKQYSDTMIVVIIISPINDNAPVSYEDTIQVIEGGTAVTLITGDSSVLANDTDLDGMDGITAMLVDSTLFGMLTLNADGTFKYIHNGTENYVDSFTYVANDGVQQGSKIKVTIIITSVEKPVLVKRASYLDLDGDGIVERVKLELNRLADELTDKTIFTVNWNEPNISGVISVFETTDNSYVLYGMIDDIFPTIQANRTGGKMSISIKYDSFDTTIVHIVVDSAGPVLISAKYITGYKKDDMDKFNALEMVFSEQMVDIESKLPFRFETRDGGNKELYTMSLTFVNSDSAEMLFDVNEIIGIVYPGNNDSVWIHNEANVADAEQNLQSVYKNKRVLLEIIHEVIDFEVKTIVNTGSNGSILPTKLIPDGLVGGAEVMIVLFPDIVISKAELDAIAELAKVSIFDVVGNIIAACNGINQTSGELLLSVQEYAGRYALVIGWTGKNRNGRLVSKGDYVAAISIRIDNDNPNVASIKLANSEYLVRIIIR